MVSVNRQPQFLRRIQNRPALRRRSGFVVFLQLALVASGVAVGGGLAYVVHRATAGDETFRVRELDLSGVPVALRAAVAERIGWARGRNVLTADLDAVRHAVEAVPEVASARVRRLLPAMLEVEVELRQPAVRLVTRDGVWAVSPDGVVLGRDAVVDLPEVRADVTLEGRVDESRRLPRGGRLDHFGAAVRVHTVLRDVGTEAEHVRLDPRGLIVALSGPDVEVLVSDAEGLAERLEALRSLWSRAPIESSALIDLRYPDMVIVSQDGEPPVDGGA